VPYHLRTPEQITGFFAGLKVIEPGIVPIQHWRPEPDPFGPPREVATLGGVARKP
jgi:S-adenosyl methyltransferase